ncbi:hypothetical protein Tco_0678368 [Tanacetum coccineum]|uniref:Reverse transcriptase domain-containing protein n=1 Tax=Tanacetum coccineum TaxID=301880 RepID=A0ABQ4XEV6_9ASTR
MKRQKTSKDVESSKGSKSKESKSTSSSKGTTRSQSKSSGKSAQAEELIHTVDDTEVQQNQGQDTGNTDYQPNVEVAPKHDWFKKPKRPPTPDLDWNFINTPIEFSAYVTNHLKIDNLTQNHLVGPVFNLLKRTCRSHVELEYNIEECYKAATDRLDWNNPEGKKYPFDIIKPLPLIVDQDMLLLLVQKKLSNLEKDVIFDLGVPLRMFTKPIVILKRVEDLQLGVESYQKKLNIIKQEIFRLMRMDELYKFMTGCSHLLDPFFMILLQPEDGLLAEEKME